MAAKKTMESLYNSRFDPLESELPQLDDNDVWFYQTILEKFIARNAPGMDGRYQVMLRVLCAQARRCNHLLEDDE